MQRLLAVALVVVLAPGAGALELLVPAYQYPTLGSFWSELTSAAGQAPVTAIVNPASGPGGAVDPTYVTTVDAFRAAGGRTLGYVATSYGAKSTAAVLAEVDTFASFYALDGIFLDEMANADDPAVVDAYAAIYAGIRARDPSWLVVGNPGTSIPEAYLARPTADVLVVFESGASAYAGWTPEPWTLTYPPAHFAEIVHSAAASEWQAVFDRVVATHAAWLFVTDDVLANPYDEAPSYFAGEVARVAAPETRGARAAAVAGLALAALQTLKRKCTTSPSCTT